MWYFVGSLLLKSIHVIDNNIQLQIGDKSKPSQRMILLYQPVFKNIKKEKTMINNQHIKFNRHVLVINDISKMIFSFFIWFMRSGAFMHMQQL